eukprot:scaffold151724_cov50-Cyclotella_meneghiniana.AAC.1
MSAVVIQSTIFISIIIKTDISIKNNNNNMILSSISKLPLAALSFSSVDVYGRPILRSNESIANHIAATSSDAPNNRFTITAQLDDDDNNHNGFASNTISIDVIQASSAITPDTSIVLSDGRSIKFRDSSNNNLDSLLVSDTTTTSNGLIILAVDPFTHETQGVVEDESGRSIKIHQNGRGGVVEARREEKLVAPHWECGLGKSEEESNLFFHNDGDLHETEEREEEHRRGLERDHEHHHHEHHHHDDHHHHHHDEFDPSVSAIENLSKSLGGTKVNPLNKRRILSNSNLPYNYQVDLFIEIDTKFIEITGGGSVDEAGITQSAYNYINTLVTASNVIYESEIDTHLHVHSIKLSTLYDSSTSTSEALTIMRNAYGGNNWHAPNVDLQHALLGLKLGGGIAYIGSLCNTDYGFGLTADLMGDFTSLDQRVVWDLKAFMQQIGHGFSSGHTHDTNYYDPAIDTCGTVCPSSPGNQWSTIMSYCHGCPGDYDSFGGVYDGSGPKSDLANWMANPELVANQDSTHSTVDPHREAYTMYSHVSSRGSCVFTPAPEVTVSLATYDSTLKVPKCDATVESCSSGDLLDGRASMGPAEQGNSPNTLDSCTDGTIGSYHGDESLDSIKVSSTVGRVLTAGDVAEIEATVYSFDPYADALDLYYTTNPSNPTWTLIGTANPPGRGLQTIKMRYTLPAGELQAVRGVFRYKGSASTATPFQCPSSGYDDIDDLAFLVSDGSTPATTSPTNQRQSIFLYYNALHVYNVLQEIDEIDAKH